VAALRCDGIEAPGVFGGPINSAWFLAYVEQCLLPTRCGQATSSLPTIWEPRKTKQYETPFRAAGAKRIFLPAYSPDLNPIGPSTRSATISLR
jgi:putative transposase